MFGRYRIDELLGRGGMGEVHRAHDTDADRAVALKRLSVADADDEARARFRRESRIAASLHGPHIVTIHDHGEIDGRLYLAMDLVEGTDLRRVLDDGPLPAERAMEILSQVAVALDAAHAAGVVHRDVKPANILLDESGTAYLVDFGIAKSLAPDATSVTRTGEIGTLDYMAPERLTHRGADHRADVYALACVLFECLTGKKPFPAEDAAGKLAAQLNDPPPAPSVFDWRIPRAVDLVIATGMDKEPDRRYPSAGQLTAAATTAFRQQATTAPVTTPNLADSPEQGHIMDAIVAVAARQPARTDQCPYPGLRSFSADESDLFHGREHAVTDVLVRLSRQGADSGPLLVVGASGTGKSSLLRAGVLPALAATAQPWPQLVMTPGPYPVRTLAARVAPVVDADADGLVRWLYSSPAEFGRLCARLAGDRGGRLVLVVDQFEELFTLAVPAERDAFATLLAHAWPALVVAAVRADFVDHCLRLPALRTAMASPYPLGPLAPADLERIITAPARAAGLSIEDGLVDRLITDVGARDGGGYDPGALPRLAHALRETWQNRTGPVLTLKDYQDTGGVERAVALTADGVYNRLSEPDRAQLRTALLRMVTVLDGGGVARRKAPRGEIPELVLARLVESRLVTAEADGVQLSHDALLTAWPRLREWVEEDRQGLVLRQHLGQAAASWHASGRDEGELYRGARLAATLEWADRRADLTDAEQGFLLQSKRVQQKQTRRLHGLVTGLAVFLVVALLAGVLAAVKWGDATREADNAERAAATAQSRQLAAEALADADAEPVGARRKALDAWRTSPTTQARGALLSSTTHEFPRLLKTGLHDAYAVDISSDGALVAAGDGEGRFVVLDTATGRPIDADFDDVYSEGIFDVRFSPDGTMLATASSAPNSVRIWAIPSGKLLSTLPANGFAAWRPDSEVVAAMNPADGRIGTWHAREGTGAGWLTAPHQSDTEVPLRGAYSSRGDRFALARSDGAVELWNTAKATLVHVETGHRDLGSADAAAELDVAFSGDLLASGSPRDGMVRFADAKTGKPVGEPMFAAFPGRGLVFPEGGGDLLTLANVEGEVARWNVARRQRTGGYAAGSALRNVGLLSLAGSRRGDVVAGRLDGDVLLWRHNQHWNHTPADEAHRVRFRPDGKELSAYTVGGVHAWRPATGESRVDDGKSLPPFAMDYLPGGGKATGYLDGTLTVTGGGEGARTVALDRPGFVAGHITASPDGSTLAVLTVADSEESVAERFASISVWDTRTLRKRASLNLGTGTPLRPVFSPDGTTLLVTVTGPEKTELKRWRTEDFRGLDPIPVTARSQAVYTPDGESLVVHTDTRVQVLDAATGEVRREFGDHPSYVTAMAVSPDGRLLATGTEADPVIRVWNLATGTLVAALTGHEGGVNDLAFSPDGDRLASASKDTDVGLWPVDPAAAAREVCDDLAAAGEKDLTSLGCAR
ncbi:protein kinase [Actinophytocola sp. NPDC049390]|uniref:nSTAND1 domain-containing NTPase n=1 Tax=Actinophytocola sp. NPDC049390 TaxID=3363894 RepID=UPI003792B192